MLTLLHGPVGYSDELLVLGIAVTIGLVIYFVFAIVESRSKPWNDQDEEDRSF
jgi:hypothetical protein